MRTGTGKRKPIKRYASGGTYQPLGLPTDPAEIRAQKAELHKTDSMNFTEGLGKFATNILLPMAMTAMGGPGGAAMGSALSKGIGSLGARNPITPAPVGELKGPTIDYVDPSIGSAQGVATAAMGGDLPLSSSSFQVKGNPQVTDGNYYPNLNAKLDHNEVITSTQNGGNFVFSDILKEGDRSFASHAKEYEAAKGKAEKRLKANPNDEQSKSTISQTNGLLEALATRQEMLAASKGLRNPDGSTVQHAAYGGKLAAHTPMTVHNWQYTRPPVKTIRLANGGPIDPPVLIDADRGFYYDKAQNAIVLKRPNGSFTTVVSNPTNDDWPVLNTLRSQKSTKPFLPVRTTERVLDDQLTWSGEFDPANNPVTPSPATSPVTTSPTVPTNSGRGRKAASPVSKYNYDVTTQGPITINNNPQGISIPGQGSSNTDISMKDVFGQTNPSVKTENIPDATRREPLSTLPYKLDGRSYRIANTLDGNQVAAYTNPDGSPYTSVDQVPKNPLESGAITSLRGGTTPSAATTSTSAAGTGMYKTPWTGGDSLKLVELFGKGIDAFGNAEVEKPQLDTSQISKESYDPRAALHRNSRNYQNFINSTTSGSLNTRRALGANALSSKLNADNQVLSQYNQMNQAANTAYESRLQGRRQFNIGQLNRTSDINAANRGAQDAVTQNFLTSVGQFGEDLNRKKYSSDLVNLLQLQYPDVYKNVYNQLPKN